MHMNIYVYGQQAITSNIPAELYCILLPDELKMPNC